ncbi:hypothetical protein [Exiguobacterium sp. s149]|uniref:hypothetical protein n=1 Tax=Exiguobacterium TaxID=33986 RepID=UPI001BEAA457|nr:hypothetical protein [Exiguobacterium sp. s149]
MLTRKHPPALRSGDTIGIITPSFPAPARFPAHVFPIGIEVELDATAGTITFLENGVTS